ncbi:cation:proton antiporter [Kitasatospora sp. NPDC058162]|uniref:cation:proton antiporter n=1 Tax=Kitasatospora sp. NPDC058162 TaxID=3346362 RepID=UPI0036D89001
MTRRSLRVLAPYLLMVVAPLAIGVLVLRTGTGFETSSAGSKPGGATDTFAKLLLALPVILLACHLLAAVFRRLGQPPVMGEIIAGVLLGPSLLGWAWPAGFHWLLPAELTPSINVLAQVGLVLFMFLVGHELNVGLLRHRAKAAVMVSHASIALPFLSGIVLALQMYGSLGEGVSSTGFALFFAVSMSITAFPVLARILHDRGMSGSELASLALTCAAVDDVTAWCLLAVVTAVATGTSVAATGLTVVLTIAFVAVMLLVVKPLMARLLTPREEGARGEGGEADGTRGPRGVPASAALSILLGGLLLSAFATEKIGIHPIFGAFLFGAITPRGLPQVKHATDQVRGLTVTFLLPLFFVYTGLRSSFGLLGTDASLWLWCSVITLVAITGKWVASTVAARVSGIGRRDAWSIGALMNCRGLTELVVLNVGLDLKIISPTVFTMLVIMTLVTTMITAPALSLIERFFRGTPPETPSPEPRVPADARLGSGVA